MKNGVLIIMLSLLASIAHANIIATVESPQTCERCGMDRTMFAHSRMLAVHTDGSTTGVCSLHCMAEEMQQINGKRISTLKVADYLTKELIDAKKAIWVVGGSKSGVMTSEAKWAFSGMEDAQKFIRNFGGKVKSFVQTLEIAKKEVKAHADEERAVEQELSRELR